MLSKFRASTRGLKQIIADFFPPLILPLSAFSLFGSFLSSALEKSPSSVTLCQETGGLSVAGATPERGQKGVKEKPLILTFRQPIEDHVNQNVGSAPAGAVAAERRRPLIPNCSFMPAGGHFQAHQTGH